MEELLEYLATVRKEGYEDFDWKALYKAKLALIGRIWGDPQDSMWLFVDLADALLQYASDNELWSLPTRVRPIRKSELIPTEIKEGDLCWDPERAVGMQFLAGEWVDLLYWDWTQHVRGRK